MAVDPSGTATVVADGDGALGIVGAVFSHRDALGQQLHGLTQQGDVGAKARGLGPVQRDRPFDAGQGARVGHVGETADPVHAVADGGDRLRLHVTVAGGDLQADGLACGGAARLSVLR